MAIDGRQHAPGDAPSAAMGEIELDREVARLLRTRGVRLAVAESCTGGLIGHRVTSISGSSDYFLGGIIAYANEVKVRELGVAARDIEQFGAVSEPVARGMAAGARRRFGADVALGVTGIAGPEGGSRDKPVGLVFIGLAVDDGVHVRRFNLAGTRDEIKWRASSAALMMLRDWLIN